LYTSLQRAIQTWKDLTVGFGTRKTRVDISSQAVENFTAKASYVSIGRSHLTVERFLDLKGRPRKSVRAGVKSSSGMRSRGGKE